MGRSPCCSKEGLNRGAWTALEDKILIAYIKAHGEGKWRSLPKRAGLKRCGKSCRLRWLNYLRPDIKRGNISEDEEELIIRLHNLLGNRWSLIAGRLPGRTDNEIKNYWNTTLGKKAQAKSCLSPSNPNQRRTISTKPKEKPTPVRPPPGPLRTKPHVIRTKAMKCTKVLMPPPSQAAAAFSSSLQNNQVKDSMPMIPLIHPHQTHSVTAPHQDNLNLTTNTTDGSGDFCAPYSHHHESDFLRDLQVGHNLNLTRDNNTLSGTSDCSLLLLDEPMLPEELNANGCLQQNFAMDLGSIASFLDTDEWP
ncbi:PREDICTED: myb-related protein Myb4-like [Nelumbo nucifera]|uniref:Myb-related protein Myb4-like n=2 Tax=Nelumbo nucifera TaxID=4432 RepID=A0A1U8AZU7_NELNU|nr:PREDICTED: myb-related protein Myb4-like [Nelumbo nucifera]DAD49090.1 TPA_asm: hypothetical protein HUJ06_019027 [Nelumbo nucifera]